MPLHIVPLSDQLHPTLLLPIPTGAKEHEKLVIPALIDTGFDGFLSIPIYLAKELNLEILGETEVELADGAQYTVKVAMLTIEFLDYIVEVEAILGEDQEGLIGISLINQMCEKFCINFKELQLEFELKLL